MRLILVWALVLSSCFGKKVPETEATCASEAEDFKLTDGQSQKTEEKDPLFEDTADEGCKLN